MCLIVFYRLKLDYFRGKFSFVQMVECLLVHTNYFSKHFSSKTALVFVSLKDVSTGESLLFAPRLPADYAVWMGEIKPLSYFKVKFLLSVGHIDSCYVWAHSSVSLQERYMVSMVYYVDEIGKVLRKKHQTSREPELFLLHGINTDSNNFSKPAEFEVINFSLSCQASHSYSRNKLMC